MASNTRAPACARIAYTNLNISSERRAVKSDNILRVAIMVVPQGAASENENKPNKKDGE